MSKSTAYLAVTLFSLSLPVQTWALVAQSTAPHESLDSFAAVDLAIDIADAPECPRESSATTTVNDPGGAAASTDDVAAAAETTACCWVYVNGIWWCVRC